MRAEVGDELAVRGVHQGDEDRHGEIIRIDGADSAPPYLVRWRDGHQTVFARRPGPRSPTTRRRAPDRSASYPLVGDEAGRLARSVPSPAPCGTLAHVFRAGSCCSLAGCECPGTAIVPVGYFGASTGTAAA
jgi:Domain of unknown function (DUF1918)